MYSLSYNISYFQNAVRGLMNYSPIVTRCHGEFLAGIRVAEPKIDAFIEAISPAEFRKIAHVSIMQAVIRALLVPRLPDNPNRFDGIRR